MSVSGARRPVSLLVGALGLALLVGAAPAVDAPPAAAAVHEVTAKAPRVASKPDLVSAALAARSQGSKVEAESERTENTTTWVNPDGTLTTEAHSGQVRFKDTHGRWQDVDLDLAEAADGTIAPKGQAFGLRLGGGTGQAGESAVATSQHGAGRSVTVAWHGQLPKPVVSGSTATFPEVSPGVDLTVQALRSGFEQSFVLRQRPTGPVSWQLPLLTRGLTARQDADGGVSFVDAKGVARSRFAPATAWDTATDPLSGDPVNRSSVTMSVAQQGKGRAVLTVTPDAQWLADPARRFPVTVDPTYAALTVYPSFDAFVESSYATDQSTAIELKLGTFDGGTTKARSFLSFPMSSWKGYKVMSASLWLDETYSYSCTARSWEVWDTGAVSSSVRWTAQPTWNSRWATSSVTMGYSSSCPGGRVAVPVTSLAQAWAGNGNATNTLGIRASDETDSYGWKKFASSESAYDPYLSITYDRKPGAAAAPTFTPSATFTPAGSTSYSYYTSDSTPAFTSKASDPDGNTVQMKVEVHSSTTTSSTTLKASCSTAFVASGSNGSCTPTTALPDGQYYARVAVYDGYLWNGTWSSWQAFKVAAAIPPVPTVSCPAPYTNGSWQDGVPSAAVSCSVTATGSGTSAPAFVLYKVDGGAEQTVQIPQSSDPSVAKSTVSVPNTAGGHSVVARTKSPSNLLSADSSTYQFGYGGTSLTSPTNSPRVTTTGVVKIAASGPPRGTSSSVTASVQWRVAGAGSETVGWNPAGGATVSIADNGSSGVSVTGTWDTTKETSDTAAGITLNDRVPVLLDVQVCLTYTSGTQCTWSQQPTSVLRVPHAFGSGFPVADAGPGQVALWTGEFNTDTTDISVPGYTGSLSLSRSHSTFAGATNSATGVFGPGWTAQLDGPDAGAAGMQVVDSTRVDGTVALIDSDGSALVFSTPNGARRSTSDLPAGTYMPVDEDTQLDGSALVVSGSGAATTLTYTEDDGTKTVWTVTAAPTASSDAVFLPISVTEPGSISKTTYSHDAAGRVTRIVAASPVTCTPSTDPTVALLTPGCRSLRLEYATTTGTTFPGDYAGRLKSVWLDIYDPDKTGGPGGTSVKVASYSYDSAGRLVSVTDPRSNLTTGYGYDAANRLTSLTPPGQPAYTFTYAASPVKLSTVTRPRPDGAVATLARVVYGVTVNGDGTALPNLGATVVDDWQQKSAPTYAAAVFGPDAPEGTTDFTWADLQYTDALGYTVNSASYGAGKWLVTATDYDGNGNVTRQLDAGAIEDILSHNVPAGLSADDMATQTVYNARIPKDAALPVLTPAGTFVVDTFGPARWATLSDGATQAWVRPRTHTDYDEGAPNGDVNPDTQLPYRLATTQTVTAYDPGSGQDVDTVSVTRTGYTAVDASADGWKLGQPTTTTTVMSGDSKEDIVRTTLYDADGRVIETRQPSAAGTSANAGTTQTVYYRADGGTGVPACDNPDPDPSIAAAKRAAWAGLTCLTRHGADPDSGPTMPSSIVAKYSYLLAPAKVVETSGPVTRTTTTTFLADGRTDTTSTAVTGLGAGEASTPVATSRTTYDSATGQPHAVQSLDASGAVSGQVVTDYDSWGRVVGYTDAKGGRTTTAYDPAGRVATVTDPFGNATSYGYGTDLAGKTERRGMPTSITVAGLGSFSGRYDADGKLVEQYMPGGVSQQVQYDDAGDPVGLTYQGQVTSVDPGTGAVSTASGDWLGWSQDNDVAGRVVREWTPTGAAFTDGPASDTVPGSGAVDAGDALSYDRQYSYDRAGRLRTVRDRTSTATGDALAPTDPATTSAPCLTRTYAFDVNGNRLSRNEYPANADGSCVASTTGATASSSRSWTYDAADRTSTSGYRYDELGRTLTIPAVDAPRPGGGDITLGYYDTDAIASITQAGTTASYSLDPAGRRLQDSTGPTGGTATSLVTRRYGDGSDSPAWVETSNPSTGSAVSVTRYAENLGGDLGGTVTGTGPSAGGDTATLDLTNLHGDIATTVTLPAGGVAATGIDGWSDYDEYGQPRTGDGAGDALGYGWLGGKQRATDTAGTGLTLMGARVYNPVTGHFTSIDPVKGGSPSAYAYPDDPLNQFDLDGQRWHFHWHSVTKVLSNSYFQAGVTALACSTGVGCAAAVWGFTAYNAYSRGRKYGFSSRRFFVGTAVDIIGNRVPVGQYRSLRRFTARMGSHRGTGAMHMLQRNHAQLLRDARRRVAARNATWAVRWGVIGHARDRFLGW
ncbi:MAG: DNRLRE domain-containing protein [Motilibacteraceae bacterium]